jgi:hypothetical protein
VQSFIPFPFFLLLLAKNCFAFTVLDIAPKKDEDASDPEEQDRRPDESGYG